MSHGPNNSKFEEGRLMQVLVAPIVSEKATMIGEKSNCLLYTSPSPRDRQKSRMPSSA